MQIAHRVVTHLQSPHHLARVTLTIQERHRAFIAFGRTTLAELDFLDEPPESTALTDYDRKHMKLYIRLLDAAEDGAHWKEVVEVLFGIDANSDPERAQSIHDAHLARARWMTEHGYRHLLRMGYH